MDLVVKLVVKVVEKVAEEVVERDHLGGLPFHLVTEFSLRIQY